MNKSRPFGSLTVLSAVLLLPSVASAQRNVRVADYNIQFLSTDVQNQGNRLQRLQQVITLLDADVIGLEEIADRAALQQVFPSDKWDILIDDDSGDAQDLAIVARHPFKIIGVNANLNADDSNFLFPGPQNDTLFPNRRDLLFAEIQIPDTTDTFFVMVTHAKSRLGAERSLTPDAREPLRPSSRCSNNALTRRISCCSGISMTTRMIAH